MNKLSFVSKLKFGPNLCVDAISMNKPTFVNKLKFGPNLFVAAEVRESIIFTKIFSCHLVYLKKKMK